MKRSIAASLVSILVGARAAQIRHARPSGPRPLADLMQLLHQFKSQTPGTTVVITPPAQTAHVSFPITVIGYFAQL